jgi:hypothetical protein
MTRNDARRWAPWLLLLSACGADDGTAGWAITASDAGDASSAATIDAASSVDARADTEGAVDAGGPMSSGASDSGARADAAEPVDAGAPPMCLVATEACDDVTQCCGELSCDTTTLGRVCCGEEGAPCSTDNGEDCCRDLLCIAGRCGYELDDACESPCTAAPALTLERERLRAIGGSFLGICGDANHTYGFHVPAARLPASDYSLEGGANDPVCQWHAAAIDIGMDWPASRDWLRWLIARIERGELTGIAEVIGSYDGNDVRYWSDSAGWSLEGNPYTGSGHDTWTHVAIHRSTALQDHGILAGWTTTSGP